jgi:spore maturation protein CgeB
MKILFYRYGSICEPFLLSAFQELGIEVTELSYEITNKSFTPAQCAKVVSKELMDSNYTLVFSMNFFPAISDVCNILKIKYVGWVVDSPVMELYNNSIQNDYNFIFLFDKCLYQEIEPLNPGHIFYMPLATDPSQTSKAIQTASVSLNQRLTSKLTFVGSLYTEKCPYDRLEKPSKYLKGFLNGIIEAQLLVYGYYFIDELLTESIVNEFKSCLPGCYTTTNSNYLTDTTIVSQLYIGGKISALERLRTMSLLSSHFETDIYTGSDTTTLPRLHNHGFAKTLTEMPVIFHNSTINLNITAKPIRSGLPLRIWDVLGCEGFLITNYQAELTDFLTIGEEIESYSSMDELVNKCHYYLEHPAKAKEIAHNAYELICRKHTYLHRLESIFNQLFYTSAERN